MRWSRCGTYPDSMRLLAEIDGQAGPERRLLRGRRDGERPRRWLRQLVHAARLDHPGLSRHDGRAARAAWPWHRSRRPRQRPSPGRSGRASRRWRPAPTRPMRRCARSTRGSVAAAQPDEMAMRGSAVRRHDDAVTETETETRTESEMEQPAAAARAPTLRPTRSRTTRRAQYGRARRGSRARISRVGPIPPGRRPRRGPSLRPAAGGDGHHDRPSGFGDRHDRRAARAGRRPMTRWTSR